MRARRELIGPACPPAAEYVWAWFRELDAARSSSGFGTNPLSFSELEAFARVHGIQMSGFEAEWLRALDAAALASAAEAQKKP